MKEEIIPIIMGDENKDYKILRVSGTEEVVTHLRNMGFVPDAIVSILQKTESGIIVKLYESRVAIDRTHGSKIDICEA